MGGMALGAATSRHPDAVLAGQAIKMAVAARGGDVAGVVFHTDCAEVAVKPRSRDLACW
jgi:hypothetical protein